MSSRRADKKLDTDKNINYKNMITQYYDKDSHLMDISTSLKKDFPEI